MARHVGVELDDYEIEDFLHDRGLGVLGLAAEGDAYTFPVAFAYDDVADRCIFRFVMDEGSLKREFVQETERASLTAYEWHGEDEWKSVVLRGPIRQVPDDDLAQAAALFSDVGTEAALEVFNEPIAEYETAWYELAVDEMTGRGRFPESERPE